MMELPVSIVKVAPVHKCDICKEKNAGYYDTLYYIHICSIECFNQFITGYNREIDEIARKLLKPDDVEEGIRKSNNDL